MKRMGLQWSGHLLLLHMLVFQHCPQPSCRAADVAQALSPGSLLYSYTIRNLIPRGTDLQPCNSDFRGVGHFYQQCKLWCGVLHVAWAVRVGKAPPCRQFTELRLKLQILDSPALVTILLIWQNLVGCKIWFDGQSLCLVPLNTCETVWSLTGLNSHLNCPALSPRQVLYSAKVLSLL